MNDDQPAPGARRIATLDIIRGVAVMGILIMNIVAFAMPEAAYSNPAAYGGDTGANLAIWAFNFVFIDGKMRGLFSFLFGASMLLVIDRAAAKGESPARVHFSRMFWLFLFGEAHFILLWWGDILNHYALVGCFAWFFRKLPAHKLVAIAIILIAVEVLLVSGLPFNVHATEIAAHAPHASAKAIRDYKEFQASFGKPDPAQINTDLALYRGPYAALVAHGLHEAVRNTLQTFVFVGLETLGYMLLGMACLKSGLLTGDWSRERYRHWIMVGAATGIPASIALVAYIVRQDFSLMSVVIGGIVLPTVLRPLMIIAWACAIIFLIRHSPPLATRIGAAGRMAFSNYLGTSIMCTSLFYGFGFGLYGHLARIELYPVVLGIWALMLLWSKPWLAHFRYGPLEWLWRTLARLRFQPMRGGVLGDFRPESDRPNLCE